MFHPGFKLTVGARVVGALLVVSLASSPAWAGKDPLGKIGEWLAAIDARLTEVLAGMGRVEESLARPCGRLEVQAGVNEGICASGPIQCSDGGSGHGYSKATAANHNPVTVAVAVTRNGQPISGLTGTNFFLNGISGPAGGHGLALCHHSDVCGTRSDFFSESHSTGVYTMFVHPSILHTWREGTHFSTVRVVLSGGESASALVRIDIPPG